MSFTAEPSHIQTDRHTKNTHTRHAAVLSCVQETREPCTLIAIYRYVHLTCQALRSRASLLPGGGAPHSSNQACRIAIMFSWLTSSSCRDLQATLKGAAGVSKGGGHGSAKREGGEEGSGARTAQPSAYTHVRCVCQRPMQRNPWGRQVCAAAGRCSGDDSATFLHAFNNSKPPKTILVHSSAEL